MEYRKVIFLIISSNSDESLVSTSECMLDYNEKIWQDEEVRKKGGLGSLYGKLSWPHLQLYGLRASHM